MDKQFPLQNHLILDFFIKQDSYQEFPQQILLTIGCLGDWADLSFWWVLNPILQGLAPNAPGQTREDAF